MKFTYAYIEYKKEVFDKYLGPCLDKIKKNIDIISEPNIKPAKFFNKVIKNSKNNYIIFSHEDITFSEDLLECIEKSIQQSPNFGVLCIVGKNSIPKYVGANRNNQATINYCDPCFFIINNNNNFLFDEKTFDDFHFVAEDYCIGIKEKLNKPTITLLYDWGNDLKHYGHTSRSVKYQWGKYHEYKEKFIKKWGKLQSK